MTHSYVKYLHKDVRAAAGADEGDLEADRISCHAYSPRDDQEHGAYTDDTQTYEGGVQYILGTRNFIAHLNSSLFRHKYIVLYSQ